MRVVIGGTAETVGNSITAWLGRSCGIIWVLFWAARQRNQFVMDCLLERPLAGVALEVPMNSRLFLSLRGCSNDPAALLRVQEN
jgi:hypothetical protein